MPDGSLRELRREQILAAASEIVSEGGLEALTIGAIEKRVSFSRGVLTYHFVNKNEIVEGLLLSAVDAIDRSTELHVREADGVEEKVHAAVEGIVRGFLANPVASIILMSFWGRLRGDEAAARVNAGLYRKYRGAARSIVRDIEHIDVEAFSTVFVGVLIGIACQTLFDPSAIDPEAAIEEASHTLCARLA